MPATAVKEGVSLGDFDEYVDLMERMADDPDEFVHTDRTKALMAQYAQAGARVGFQHGGPSFVSVGAPFLAAASGVQIGVDHAG